MSSADVAAAASERATFGLPADPELVRGIIESGQDVGTARWGIVLTEQESITLDIEGRMAAEADLVTTVIPAAKRLEAFGGAYFDQVNGGRLVIQLTNRNAEDESQLRSLTAQPPESIEFREVAIAYRELEEALHKARDNWQAVADGRVLPAVGIDEPTGSVRFHVLPADMEWAQSAATAIESSLGVPATLQVAELGSIAACTSRDNCWDPKFKTGARIYLGGIQNPITQCTMGFHISTSQSDEQFITSGHCGYGSSYHSWYHPTYGLIGNEGANLHYEGMYDIMRVHMADVRASNMIIDVRPIVGSTWPSDGMILCSSLGYTDPPSPDCGTVTDPWFSYQSPGGCNCTQWGGDVSNIFIQDGDSGSPLVVYNSSTTSLAVGVVATSGGVFARVEEALLSFTSSVYVP